MKKLDVIGLMINSFCEPVDKMPLSGKLTTAKPLKTCACGQGFNHRGYQCQACFKLRIKTQ